MHWFNKRTIHRLRASFSVPTSLLHIWPIQFVGIKALMTHIRNLTLLGKGSEKKPYFLWSFAKPPLGPSWLPYSTDFIFVFVSWVGGGNPPWAVPKSLRPHCDQEKQAGDNFFAKYPCHAYRYESHAKKTAPKKVKNLLKTAVSSDWQPHPGNGEQACSLPLSSSPHQPAFTGKRRRTALRLTRSLYKWDFNLLDGIFGRIAEFWPCISVFLPRMHGKKCISSPLFWP